MNLDLSDEESAALIRELADITENHRYPFSAPHPDAEGHPRKPQARAGSRALAAQVRFIVWCKACRHQVEPDPPSKLGDVAAGPP